MSGDAPIRRHVSLDRCNNSVPFLGAIEDDLARIVALFARWIYDDCRPRVVTGMAVTTYYPRYIHYAVTIFIDASFYGPKRRVSKGRAVGTADRTLGLPAPIV